MNKKMNSRLTPEVLAALAQEKTARGFQGPGSDNATLQAVLNDVKRQAIDVDTLIQLLECTAEEIAEINQALEGPHTDIWSFLKEGLLKTVRHRNAYTSSSPETSAAQAQLRKSQKHGADAQIATVVAQLMYENEHAEHTLQQVYISAKTIETIAHVNTHTAIEYCTTHRAELDEHHASILGIVSAKHGARHNLLRAQWARAQREGSGERFLAQHAARLVSRNGAVNTHACK
jgi:hypothetical protein